MTRDKLGRFTSPGSNPASGYEQMKKKMNHFFMNEWIARAWIAIGFLVVLIIAVLAVTTKSEFIVVVWIMIVALWLSTPLILGRSR